MLYTTPWLQNFVDETFVTAQSTSQNLSRDKYLLLWIWEANFIIGICFSCQLFAQLSCHSNNMKLSKYRHMHFPSASMNINSFRKILNYGFQIFFKTLHQPIYLHACMNYCKCEYVYELYNISKYANVFFYISNRDVSIFIDACLAESLPNI